MKPSRLKIFVIVATLLGGGGCSARTPISNALPGNPVLAYPSSVDRQWSTSLSSNPAAQTAGVDGRVLTITTFHQNKAVADELTLDVNGDLGLRGSLSSVSTRSMKKAIAPYRADALSLLRDVNVVTFQYKYDSAKVGRRIGFIAEDTPSELSGPRHNSVNLNNTMGVELAAIKQLDSEVRSLHVEVSQLRAQLARRERASFVKAGRGAFKS